MLHCAIFLHNITFIQQCQVLQFIYFLNICIEHLILIPTSYKSLLAVVMATDTLSAVQRNDVLLMSYQKENGGNSQLHINILTTTVMKWHSQSVYTSHGCIKGQWTTFFRILNTYIYCIFIYLFMYQRHPYIILHNRSPSFIPENWTGFFRYCTFKTHICKRSRSWLAELHRVSLKRKSRLKHFL